ncbi:hypothetical protein ACTJIJ_16885 [Niabella sp. 22666]|uniref:hypothetical protein n=1 Tax=Niabella sp. 22666 TaxID=3453954 RepID=UPI003F8757BB
MFQVSIQSPFNNQPDYYNNCDADTAMELFKAIDWVQLYQTILASGDCPASPYYYYEVKRKNSLGEEETICISCMVGTNVCVGYFRPKSIQKRGLFKTKEVLDPMFQTQMDDVDIYFATGCLEAFLKGNTAYLEHNLYDKEEND